ncbi:MBL fold metallo-hydrolase [Microbaculum marinum]|uniref:MBL fold metallo-hydrolase n=1 Tax=Microbaculum marinum TaxID=1764581 RepID=A0AAW9RRI0_9HYPH
MLHRWKIGDVRVSSLVEYHGPTHDPEFLYPKFDRGAFEAILPELPPGHYYRENDRLVIAIQIWLVETADKVVLIDTGVGNHKPRSAERMKNLNSLFLHWLAAAGVTPDKVTHVVHTHMHPDHVGWNTVLRDGRWVPTFPNARYLMPKTDFDFFQELRKENSPVEDGAFTDSVDPVLEAGLADFITDETELLGFLRVSKAPGHTPGMLNYWLESRGETGVFSADVMHHPVQIYRPDWNTAFCTLQDEALRTRAGFLAEAADSGALVMSCHFAPPHTGYIRRRGGGYAFEPAASGYGSAV